VRIFEQLEEGFQNRVWKARKNGFQDSCEDLGLDPTLPYRGHYEKRCESVKISEQEFSVVYADAVTETLLDTDVVQFFPFTDLVFERVEAFISGREKLLEGQPEERETEEAMR
jgi:hypothetical protein